MRTEEEERQAVVNAARTWLGTPYIHHGRVKGRNGGADCATSIAGIYEEAGVISPVDIKHYSEQWHLHRGQELYLAEVVKYAQEIETLPQPGDLVLFKFGRCFSHGAVVIEWPKILHSYIGIGCCYGDAISDSFLSTVGEKTPTQGKPRERKFLTLWGKK